jgi:hypothetical protein
LDALLLVVKQVVEEAGINRIVTWQIILLLLLAKSPFETEFLPVVWLDAQTIVLVNFFALGVYQLFIIGMLDNIAISFLESDVFLENPLAFILLLLLYAVFTHVLWFFVAK